MVPVPVPTFEKVTVPVPVPAPYLDHKHCKKQCCGSRMSLPWMRILLHQDSLEMLDADPDLQHCSKNFKLFFLVDFLIFGK
jgi:hypothetical protein